MEKKNSPPWLLVLGVDIEGTGRLRGSKIISIGFCGVSRNNGFFRMLFLMPGIRLPCDQDGPLLLPDGAVRRVRPVSYNDFDKTTWEWWIGTHGRAVALAKQIEWGTQGMSSVDSAPLRATQLDLVRRWVDTTCTITAKHGGKVLLATDDPSYDVGEIGHEFKRYCERSQFEPCGLQFLPTSRKRRHHQHVNDVSFPKRQRDVGIIEFADHEPSDVDLSACGLASANDAHVADADATQVALTMAGYIKAFPKHVAQLGMF
jgi:hypothetical protein